MIEAPGAYRLALMALVSGSHHKCQSVVHLEEWIDLKS